MGRGIRFTGGGQDWMEHSSPDCAGRARIRCMSSVQRNENKDEKNVLGGPLAACSYDPLTGFFRDGCCATHGTAGVAHLVCVRVTVEFLEFSKGKGNDLSTPIPEMRFRGLQPGERWCLHVLRWVEAWEAGSAPGSCSRPPTRMCCAMRRCRR